MISPVTAEFSNVPARDIGEGTRLVRPAGTLTPMIDAVEWVGDPDDTEFE
jgi:hypothetical protein